MTAPTGAASAGPALRDIHVPPAPGWWPLAPGWWLLGLLALLLIAAGGYFAWRWRSRRRLWHAVRDELDALAAQHAADGDNAALAAGLSQLLRRAIIHGGGDARVQGEAWQAQIERLGPGLLGSNLIADLDRATYQRTPRLDAALALHGCRRWLRRALNAHA